jgi:hypothetical protein
MNTQAHFDNIQFYILQELTKAKHSIVIAVAWFTDNELFNILCEKSKQGVAVQLIIMNDEINNGSGIDYHALTKTGGKIWKINSETNNILMHNKFCVIDEETVINGSYNWTNKAKQNHESITIIQDKELAFQFLKEFKALKERYFGKEHETTILNYAQLCIRLDNLKNAISLEDEEDIAFQLRKLNQICSSASEDTLLFQIIENTKKKHYSQTVVLIEKFVSKYRSLTVYIDTEIAAMPLEIKVLGIQISSLEDEKAEIEKSLHAFNLRYNQELGELLLQILRLRKEQLQEEAKNDFSKAEEAKEAENDYQEFNQSFEKSKNQHINLLNENQQTELKQKYRKASKLCHPDVVNEVQNEQATKIFQKLKDAYDTNDLQMVSQILSDLEKGIFTDKASEISEKQKLSSTIMQLRTNRDKMEEQLNLLKQSETYQTVLKIEDWDSYFIDLKEKLEEEYRSLSDRNNAIGNYAIKK